MASIAGTLVITFPGDLTPDQAKAIKADLAEKLPQAEIVIVSGASSAVWLPEVRRPRRRPPLVAR